MKLFSYHCSQHSTPATIVEVFNNAKKFQESKDMKQLTKQFVSVVVLNEVSLAEDSPSLPLTALHSLLGDGTSRVDVKVQVYWYNPCLHAIPLNYNFIFTRVYTRGNMINI